MTISLTKGKTLKIPSVRGGALPSALLLRFEKLACVLIALIYARKK